MKIQRAVDPGEWDAFLARQAWRPFLQSWTMGDVYRDIGQNPVRLIIRDDIGILCICFAHIVCARRGKHLAVPYGPVFDNRLLPEDQGELLKKLFATLKEEAAQHDCSFIRISPFIDQFHGESLKKSLMQANIQSVPSPLHLLAEHVWYIQLQNEDGTKRSEESIKAEMRKTTRNLIGRAQRDGVTVEASMSPIEDIQYFLALHEETRKRHGFTPYSDSFFRAQVKHFSSRNECTLYLARHGGQVIAASIHIHAYGETSYHHGASSHAHSKIPSSYLLQWTAIQDALNRGDKTYNFWGIAPLLTTAIPEIGEAATSSSAKVEKKIKTQQSNNHPFAGVTLFKTGFGGELLNLMHCQDIPVKPIYWITYCFELLRKWRRGF